MGRGDNPSEDVWGLFLLLDADGNGAVDLDEFVNGCMQLRGPAKSYLPLADVCGKKWNSTMETVNGIMCFCFVRCS